MGTHGIWCGDVFLFPLDSLTAFWDRMSWRRSRGLFFSSSV